MASALQGLAAQLAARIQEEIVSLPAGFYDTFEFTATGNNLCHPLTVGILARIIGELDHIVYVGIDVRLNSRRGLKFQPDVVGFRGDLSPAIYVDFESPNSSDARILRKDVAAYLDWVNGKEACAPYVIVTSLPNCSRTASQWELRWTNRKQYNIEHRGRREAVSANPFRYWTTEWRKVLRGKNMPGVLFLNIDRRRVRPFRST